MSVVNILNIMKICCVSKLFQIELFILFHVRGMVCLIEKYERTFLRGVGAGAPLALPPCESNVNHWIDFNMVNEKLRVIGDPTLWMEQT